MPRVIEKGLSDIEYDTMLATLSATVKGRAFLSEYVNRTRPAEIRGLLNAMSQLAGTIAAVKADIRPGRLSTELIRIAGQMPNGPERQELLVLAAGLKDPPPSSPARPPAIDEELRAGIAPMRSLTEEAQEARARPTEPAEAASDPIEDDLTFGDENKLP
ncbi:hypothetical protein [Afifella pfennigii]|uniref:hypothetical protein n=1 Tax=Afifella pfennigii TaxID=209897 RepID=UPI00047E99B3|nr:hypothetical protein [Afifella pfennigii]